MDRVNSSASGGGSAGAADALRQQQQQWLTPLLEALQAAEQSRAWPEVERLCKQILQRDGDNWEVWQRLALAHEARHDWPQAEMLWRHLTTRFSNRPEPYLALAGLQRRRGTPDAARAVLEEAERTLGGSEALRRSLAEIDDPWAVGEAVPSLAADAPAAEVARALQLAQQHLDNARLPEAEAVLQQILVVKPQAVKVHALLAQLRRRRGEQQLLIDQLLPLYQPFPVDGPFVETPELALLLLEALVACQRQPEALALVEPLLQRHPEQVPVQLMAAEIHLERGDAARAHGLLEACLRRAPREVKAVRLKAELCSRLGDADGAVSALEQAMALDPADAATAQRLEQARHAQLWRRGEQALQQARWGEAETAYRTLLARDATQTRALERLDLLASLAPERLADQADLPGGDAVSNPARQRLQAFCHQLDCVETQLKMLGTSL